MKTGVSIGPTGKPTGKLIGCTGTAYATCFYIVLTVAVYANTRNNAATTMFSKQQNQ